MITWSDSTTLIGTSEQQPLSHTTAAPTISRLATGEHAVAVPVRSGRRVQLVGPRPGYASGRGKRFSVGARPPRLRPAPDVPPYGESLGRMMVVDRCIGDARVRAARPGYTGDYMVRFDDARWNGRQAPGFGTTAIALPVDHHQRARR